MDVTYVRNQNDFEEYKCQNRMDTLENIMDTGTFYLWKYTLSHTYKELVFIIVTSWHNVMKSRDVTEGHQSGKLECTIFM